MKNPVRFGNCKEAGWGSHSWERGAGCDWENDGGGSQLRRSDEKQPAPEKGRQNNHSDKRRGG